MPTNRRKGINVRFSKNILVLLNTEGSAMLSTRVLYPIADEVRQSFPDVISRAKEVY
jgi:ribosomal protein L14